MCWLHLHNAICLFINVPSSSSTVTATSMYDNMFTRRSGRMYFSWYTPSSVQPTHPLVQSLAAATTNQSEMSVLLFCRRVVSGSGSGSAVEGYRYYGRVGYVRHDEAVRPIQFVLEVLDAKPVEAVMRVELQLLQQHNPTADSDAT